MALLENLKPGQIYFVKVSASNDMGDGPFSHAVELTVREGLPLGHDIRVSRGSTSQWNQHDVLQCKEFLFFKRLHDNLTMFPRPIAFSDNFYHLDQKSMTGISVGVCIALICIIICAFIIICRGKNRYLVSLSVVTMSHINSIHFYLYRAKSQQQLSQDIEVSSMNTSLCVLSGNFLLWKHAEREWAHLLQLQDLHPLKEKLSMLMWACQWWI